MPEKKCGMSRRKALKYAGSGIAATTIPGTVTADSSFEDDIQQARKIRERTGKQEKFLKYFRDKGYLVARNKLNYHPQFNPSGQDGEVGTRKNSSNDLNVEISIVSEHIDCDPDPYRNYVDYYFEWVVNESDGEGNPGAAEDVLTIDWEDNHYYLNSTYGHHDNEDITLYEYDSSRYVVWEFDDSDIGPGMMYDATVGCTVEPRADSTDSDRFYAKYYHTWESISITDIDSVSFPLNVEFGSDDGQWVSDPEYIRWDEAEHEYTNC